MAPSGQHGGDAKVAQLHLGAKDDGQQGDGVTEKGESPPESEGGETSAGCIYEDIFRNICFINRLVKYTSRCEHGTARTGPQ
jgi:hypothetical protein